MMALVCPVCETTADNGAWRCDDCGKDLVEEDKSTNGRQGVSR